MLSMRHWSVLPLPTSLGHRLLRVPHIVEQFDHLLVDDEDDGHVQAHAAQPGNSSLVEAAGTTR